MNNYSTWISVKDRLPRHLQSVLFLYSDDCGIELLTGWYDQDNKEWVCAIVGFFRDISEKAYDDSHFKKKNVTHWMPLPEPPKE